MTAFWYGRLVLEIPLQLPPVSWRQEISLFGSLIANISSSKSNKDLGLLEAIEFLVMGVFRDIAWRTQELMSFLGP